MPRTTSYTLSDEQQARMEHELERGEFKSASEIMRNALDEYLERREKRRVLLAELDKGLASPRATPGTFDRVFAKFGIKP